VPYKDLIDLPKSVREHLPKLAQEIYRAAYNNAWDEYVQGEERAHQVAWSAVKKI
jgi:cation transport regulator